MELGLAGLGEGEQAAAPEGRGRPQAHLRRAGRARGRGSVARAAQGGAAGCLSRLRVRVFVCTHVCARVSTCTHVCACSCGCVSVLARASSGPALQQSEPPHAGCTPHGPCAAGGSFRKGAEAASLPSTGAPGHNCGQHPPGAFCGAPSAAAPTWDSQARPPASHTPSCLFLATPPRRSDQGPPGTEASGCGLGSSDHAHWPHPPRWLHQPGGNGSLPTCQTGRSCRAGQAGSGSRARPRLPEAWELGPGRGGLRGTGSVALWRGLA